MRAFVTGATGLLGSNLVELLLHEGHEVRGLARSREKAARRFGDRGPVVVLGDLDDVAGWENQLAGCDTLIHCAAYFREYYRPGTHWPLLQRRNVTATLEVLRAAERRGVARAVHVSTSGVIGCRADGSPADETTGPGRLSERNLYFRSKLHAEQAITQHLQGSSMAVMRVLPGWMFGPGDSAPTHSGRLVLDQAAGRVPFSIDAHVQPTDARDVAAGLIAAAQRGRAGERFLLAAEPPIAFTELLQLLSSITGAPAPRVTLPGGVMRLVAAAVDMLARVARRRPPLSRAAIETILSGGIVTSAKARKELGVTFRPLSETLRDEVSWFRANGYLDGAGRRGRRRSARRTPGTSSP